MRLFGLSVLAFLLSVAPGAVQMQDSATNNIGQAVPLYAATIGGNSNGNLVTVPVTNSTVNINDNVSGTTQLIALSGATSIYITHLHVIAASTGTGTMNVSFVYGTGTNCGTGTTTLDGPLQLIGTTGYAAGTGVGAIMKVPAGQALCITTDQSIQVGGAISYSQY